MSSLDNSGGGGGNGGWISCFYTPRDAADAAA
jgi:hypothetical protein